MDKPFLSVCVITGNEEANIRRCLESVSFADEIVVVDSFSRDRTLEICREFTDRIFQHRWLGYIGQKAVARNLARGEWILFVDADEAVSSALREEILSTLRRGVPHGVDGFDFPRMVWFLHRWIRHGDWYPDTKLRLFRKANSRCAGTEPHERIEVDGEVRHLRAQLYHYTYENIEDQLRTMNRFSSISAHNEKMYERSLLGILARMLLHPPFRFLRCYILKFGFLDGLAGLVIAKSVAYGTFIKYAKTWEHRIDARLKAMSSTALLAALLLFPLAAASRDIPSLALSDVASADSVKAAVPQDAAGLLATCASRMPREKVRLSGSLNMRKRYGVSLKALEFAVDADFSATPAEFLFELSTESGEALQRVRAVRTESGLKLERLDGGAPAPSPADRIEGTDVSWFDACMDFLWWKNPRTVGFERVKGRDCSVIEVDAPSPTAACATARIWIDLEQAAALQAAQFDANGRETRRLWVRAMRKTGDRWVFKDLEVESSGGVHRTRLHFENVSFPDERA